MLHVCCMYVILDLSTTKELTNMKLFINNHESDLDIITKTGEVNLNNLKYELEEIHEINYIDIENGKEVNPRQKIVYDITSEKKPIGELSIMRHNSLKNQTMIYIDIDIWEA